MIRVDITENDIVKSIKTNKSSPYEIALCRVLKCEQDRLDIKQKNIKLWFYDDSDYALFLFCNENDEYNFNLFKDRWESFARNETNEFLEEPLSFNIYTNNDQKKWAATSVKFNQFLDRPSSDKKNLKFRLTDDDDCVE